MDHPHNYGSSNSKRSYTEIAAAATAGEDCPQPQLMPLPLPVQQKLNSICEEKEQPQPDAALRRRLGLLGEEKALELLGEIYNSKKQIKTLSGYIWFLLREKYQCTPRSRSPSPSPTKSGPAASPPLHSPSSASQITPGRQGSTSGGQKQLNSYFSPSPSKSARTSLFRGPSSSLPISPVHEGPSSAPPTSITPVQLFQGDTTDNQYFQSSRASNVNATAKVSNYKSSLEMVKIPNDLKPRSFPHYMGKLNSYKSTSILGSIYDAVEEYQPEDTSDEVVEKLPCFDVEDLPEQCLKKWYELYEQYRSEMTSVLQYDDKEGKNKAADKLIRRYKEILYGCEDLEKSTRPLDEIFNEALAIYRFAYDYAWKVNDVRKCGFAWRVAGSALCKYYKTKHEDRTFEVSFSVLKDIL